MMIACGDFVVPGNKMPPNNAEAEAAYAIFIDMIENGWLTVSSESLVDGKTRIRWELLKEQEAKPMTEYDDGWDCPRCGLKLVGKTASGYPCDEFDLPNDEIVKYCPVCGQAVKWNE